jgi:hypothetical protein
MSYVVDSQRGEAALKTPEIGRGYFEKSGTMTVQFDFDAEGQGSYSVNGVKKDVPEGFSVNDLTGGFAITASEDTAVLFKHTVVRPNAAFWPVSPASDDE